MRRLQPGAVVHDVADAFEALRLDGHTLPAKLPAILPGSLRPHHRPEKVWVYDEANREWVAVAAPEARKTLIQRVRAGRRRMWWRDAELGIEQSLRSRFN
jgi:hypothetical protein